MKYPKDKAITFDALQQFIDESKPKMVELTDSQYNALRPLLSGQENWEENWRGMHITCGGIPVIRLKQYDTFNELCDHFKKVMDANTFTIPVTESEYEMYLSYTADYEIPEEAEPKYKGYKLVVTI